MLAPSSVPSWKAELLERKRLEKLNIGSVPTWKRELLKRMHSKSELTKHKVSLETESIEDKLVLDEHISKVSENVFVREELQRKMSSGHMTSQLSHDSDLINPGHHVIRTDNILIIEQEDACQDNEVKAKIEHREMVDVELPSAGTVNRLKDKFAYRRKGNAVGSQDLVTTASSFQPIPYPRVRSKPSEHHFTAVLSKKEENGPTSPTSPTHPRTQYPPHKNPTIKKSYSEDGPLRSRLPSVELVAPKGFHTRSSIKNLTAEPYHKMKAPPLLKKFSAPLLSVPKTRRRSKEESVDMASLHAPGSPERKKMSSEVSVKSPPLPDRKHSEQPIGFPQDIISLHSSSVNSEVIEKPANVEVDTQPETITLPPVEVVKFPSTSNHSKAAKVASVKAKRQTGLLRKTPSMEGPVTAASDVSAVKAPFLPSKPRLTPKPRTNIPISSNKENIPEVPQRVSLISTKPKSVTPAPRTPSSSSLAVEPRTDDNVSQNEECLIIDLGRTSMDPSLLKTKAAIAANEIMKESKTVMIIPKSKRNGTVFHPERWEGEDKKSAERINSRNSLKSSKRNVTTTEVPTSQATQNAPTVKPPSDEISSLKTIESIPVTASEDSLPSSSIDDIITTSSSENAKPIQNMVFTKSENKPKKTNEVITSRNDLPDGTTAVRSKPIENAKNPVDNGNRFIVTDKPSLSNDTVKSIFDANSNSLAVTSTRSFGGKSFVIDPRKFKRSASQPAISTTPLAQVETKKKTTLPATNGTTIVIKPKPQPDVVDSVTTDPEVTSESKGKRKLTVDQITVIGGYVRLDHSNLSKPNKMHKGIHVKFDASHLESVFQYPSEASLLREDQQDRLNERMSSLVSRQGVAENSRFDKYTPKYLLAMKESLGVEDDDDEEDDPSRSDIREETTRRNERNSTDATPLGDEDAAAFSFSSSNDLLF